MKNLLTSFLIVVLLLSSMFFSNKYLNKVCYDLLQKDMKLEEFIEKENWEQGYELSVNLFNEWEKQYDKLSVFVHHQNIDDINSELLQLTQFIQCKDKSHSLAKIHVVKFYLKNIIQSEKINIQNIF